MGNSTFTTSTNVGLNAIIILVELFRNDGTSSSIALRMLEF